MVRGVANRWQVLGDVEAHAKRVKLGDTGDSLPARFSATYASDDDLRVTVKCAFAGDRIEVAEVVVTRADDTGVVPRDLTRVQLEEIVQTVAATVISPNSNGLDRGERTDMRPTPDELALVAATYWFAYASWGDPRRAIMRRWDLPRSTANRWITKAAELHPMPARMSK